MATKLNSDVIRESSLIVDEREIVITLTEDQKISMRLKGMKSGNVDIGIRELWFQLNDEESNIAEKDYEEWKEEEEEPRSKKAKNIAKEYPGDTLISLNRLRSLNAVTHSDLDITVKLDEIIVELLKGKK